MNIHPTKFKKLYQKVPRKIFLFDYGTRYRGYYVSDNKAVIGGKFSDGHGTSPYIMFGGFNQVYAGLPIKVEGPYGTVIRKLTNICVMSNGFYNFDGMRFNTNCILGIDYSHKELPYGTNTFKITVDDDVLIYTIIYNLD